MIVGSHRPRGLAPAVYAISWDQNSWVSAHTDGSVTVFDGLGPRSIALHPGDYPTSLTFLDPTRALVGFESGKLRCFDLKGGWEFASVDLGIVPVGVCVLESTLIVWGRLALSAIVLRRTTLDVIETRVYDDVVVRIFPEGIVYPSGVATDSGFLSFPGLIDAVPTSDGMWCVVWRDRWALCDPKHGTEEFGASSPGDQEHFTGAVSTLTGGVFVRCDGGSTVHVRRNNMQVLNPLPCYIVSMGQHSLTRDLRLWDLLEKDSGETWVSRGRLADIGGPSEQYIGSRNDVTAVSESNLGYSSGAVDREGSTRMNLLPGPVLKLENGKAFSRDFIVSLDDGTAQKSPHSISAHTSPVPLLENEWPGEWGGTPTYVARVCPECAAYLAVVGAPISSELVAAGGIVNLEDLAVAMLPRASPEELDNVAECLKQHWDSGRINSLLESGGTRAAAVLGAAYPNVSASGPWLRRHLPLLLDTGSVDDLCIAISIVGRHPELLRTRVPSHILDLIPEAASNRFAQMYSRVNPKEFICEYGTNFDLVNEVVDVLGDVLPDILTLVVPHLAQSGSARRLITSLRSRFPLKIQFHRPHQRLFVLDAGVITAWDLSHPTRHFRFESSNSAIVSAEFSNDGKEVWGELEDGNLVVWRFPHGLYSLFRGDVIEARPRYSEH